VDALVALVAGDDVAIGALGFLAVELDVAGAIGDLALGLGERLAHLGGQDRRQIVLVRHAEVEPLAQHLRAFLGGAACPFAVRGVGGLDRAGGLRPAEVRQMADHVAACGVRHREGRAVVGRDPLTGDISLGHQKRGVFQKRRKVGHGIEHGWALLMLCPTGATRGVVCPVARPVSGQGLIKSLAGWTCSFGGRKSFRKDLQIPAKEFGAPARPQPQPFACIRSI
jgi:hypothetical protein